MTGSITVLPVPLMLVLLTATSVIQRLVESNNLNLNELQIYSEISTMQQYHLPIKHPTKSVIINANVVLIFQYIKFANGLNRSVTA